MKNNSGGESLWDINHKNKVKESSRARSFGLCIRLAILSDLVIQKINLKLGGENQEISDVRKMERMYEANLKIVFGKLGYNTKKFNFIKGHCFISIDSKHRKPQNTVK